MLLEEDSYRWLNRLLQASARGVSPIGDLLSHTAKSKSREACQFVLDLLREIDWKWHQSED